LPLRRSPGAPGILAGAWEYLDEELLLAGAELVWRAGAHGDEKGHGICHGTSGNGFALLKAFARTGDVPRQPRPSRARVHKEPVALPGRVARDALGRSRCVALDHDHLVSSTKGVSAMSQQGQLFLLKRAGRDGEALWAYRYRVGGRDSKRVQRGGFVSERDAGESLERELERLRRERRLAGSLTLAELVEVYLAQHDVEPVTIEKLRWLLGKAVAAFGERPVGELRSEEIAAWRIALSPGYRFDATQALRQVLARAVVWGMIAANPAKLGVDNPSPRRREQRPFECWAELEAVAANLAPRYGPMVMFAAATGLRPAEWLALEWRDIDLEARVVYVHRSFTKGSLKCPKTEASRRAVPLQTIALEAIEQQLSSGQNALVFPGERGGYLDLHNFRNREWKPAPARGRDRAPAQGLRSPAHLRHLRAPCRHLHLRPLPLHGRRQPDHDRPPLRPPRPRRTRARDPPARRTQLRTMSTVDAGGRWVDAKFGGRRRRRSS
jgi:integrase